MTKAFPIVPLGKAITHRSEFIEIGDTATYMRCRVQLHAQGIVLRDKVNGVEIKTKKQQVCRAGEFLVAEIDAKVGGFGVVPSELEGAIVSSHYFLFEINNKVLNRRFLDYYIRTPFFREQVTSRGSTNYAAIRPHHVLEYTTPLPPLSEQKRIVARIEELAGKIEEARELRKEAETARASLFDSAMNRIWSSTSGWDRGLLGTLVQLVSGQVDPTIPPYSDLPHINGAFMESGTGRLLGGYRSASEDSMRSGKFRFTANAILYSKIRPYLRKAVQVPFDGLCSADIYAIEHVDSAIEPRFLMYSLIGPLFTGYANALSGRTRMPKLNQNQLFAFELEYPSRTEQRRIVAHLDDLQSKVDALKKLQAETSAELDALLPSILDKAFKGEL